MDRIREEAIESELGLVPLDAPPDQFLRSLNGWHLGLVTRFPRSFREIKKMLTANGTFTSKDLEDLESGSVRRYLRSLTPLERKEIDHELGVLVSWVEESPPGSRFKSEREISFEQELLRIEESKKEKEKVASSGTLLELLKSSIAMLDERDQRILEGRLGLEGTALTLAEIASEFGITRERIRQLASKAFQKLEKRELWDDVFRDKLERLFREFAPAIDIRDLADIDEWFSEFEIEAKGLRVFLASFAPTVALLEVEETVFVCSKENFDALDSIVTLHRERLREFDQSARVSEIEALFRSLGFNGEENYLTKKLELVIAKQAKPTIDSIVRACLASSDTPISSSMIVAEALKVGYSQEEINNPTIVNALSKYGVAISRAPTFYASQRSIGVSKSVIARFCQRIYDFCDENFESGYVFHGEQVVDWDREISLDLELANNPWFAVALLQLDPEKRFKSNKLKFWLHRDLGDDGPRLTLNDHIRSALNRFARPAHLSIIADEVSKYQHLPNVFQIHPMGDVVSLGEGLFSLRQYADEEPLRGEKRDVVSHKAIESILAESPDWLSLDQILETFERLHGFKPATSYALNALRACALLVDESPARYAVSSTLGISQQEISLICDVVEEKLTREFRSNYIANAIQVKDWAGFVVDLNGGKYLPVALLKLDPKKRFTVNRDNFALTSGLSEEGWRSLRTDVESIVQQGEESISLAELDLQLRSLRFVGENLKSSLLAMGCSVSDGRVRRGNKEN